jgi:hypothetical protein
MVNSGIVFAFHKNQKSKIYATLNSLRAPFFTKWGSARNILLEGMLLENRVRVCFNF